MIKFAPLALLLCAAPAFANDPKPAASPEAAAKPEKKVCKAERSTGSNIPKRICRTKAEWEAAKAESQIQTDRNMMPQGSVSSM